MSAGLTYRDDIHEYRYGGAVVPSVTQILSDLSAREYRMVTREVMDDAAALGTAVHKMIELDLRDDLDMRSLNGVLVTYYHAWRQFREMSGFQMMLSEKRVYSARYGYAGTLDLFGVLNSDAVLIDAKRTAQVPRTAGPQTAAYAQALAECDDAVDPRWPTDRYALHLRKDGTWRLVPFTNTNDLRVFLACKTLHDWSNAA